MNGGPHDPPTLATLQAALRAITESLAAELACPTPVAPDWDEVEWTLARAVAAMHGVSPLLNARLRWQGPLGWTDFLREQRVHTSRRHARIDALLLRIHRRLREAGIAAVALKGAALHAMGLYAPGDRPMADIDLLVRPRDAERTARLIESLDFQLSCANWKERAFVPNDERAACELGEHSGNSIKIELHERICEKLPWHLTDISEFLFPASPHPGLNDYPSTAALMMHLLLHAAGAMAFQSLRLLHLHDLAILCARLSPADWDELLAFRAGGRRLWWALPPLALTLRYYRAPVPVRILAALRSDCTSPLRWLSRRRTLTDVSYSHLWVDAFPGFEWARSPAELLGYVASRVRPSTEHLELRQVTARTQAWAAAGDWAMLSHGRRILRWVAAGQTRPVTMHVVQAAFARAR